MGENSDSFICVSEASEKLIRETIESVQYIKLCRFHSLNDPAFPELNLAETGLRIWQLLSKVCANQTQTVLKSYLHFFLSGLNRRA